MTARQAIRADAPQTMDPIWSAIRAEAKTAADNGWQSRFEMPSVAAFPTGRYTPTEPEPSRKTIELNGEREV